MNKKYKVFIFLSLTIFLFGLFLFRAYIVEASLSVDPNHPYNVVSETTGSATDGTYPAATYSGDSDGGANSVVVQIGYGSDEHDWEITASQGSFYQKPDGTWGVQDAGSKTSSNGVERNGGMSVSAPGDSYMSGWGWSSSSTTGGHLSDDSSPAGVCVHAGYQSYDPNTFQLSGPIVNGGGCAGAGYQVPGWIRGFLTADPGTFFTGVSFTFGDDAAIRGGKINYRTIDTAVRDAQYASDTLPTAVVAGQTYNGNIVLGNSGTTSWAPANWSLKRIDNSPITSGSSFSASGTISPGANGTFPISFTMPSAGGNNQMVFQMAKNNSQFGDILTFTFVAGVPPSGCPPNCPPPAGCPPNCPPPACPPNCPPPSGGVPMVSIFANPNSGTVNIVNPTLTWSASNNPTSCTASGDWSGSKPVSGSGVPQGVLNSIRTYTYTLTCANTVGTSAPSSAEVQVYSSAPDLVADAPTPSVATINVPLSFSSVVSNTGSSSTINSFSNFFQKATTVNGGGVITDLASSSMSALSAGQSNTAVSPSVTFNVAGTYSVRACADKSSSASTGNINEGSEANNCSPWTNVAVSISSTIDLIASNPAPTTATINTPQTYTSTITNNGSIPTASGNGGGFTNLFQTSTTPDGSSGVTGYPVVGMNALPAGGSAVTSKSLTFNTIGIIYMRVCADKSSASDVNGTVTESNENNNCSMSTPWTPITVTGTPTPDLTAFPPSPSFANPGVPVSFSSMISNIGNSSTGGSFSNFFQKATLPNGGGTITDLASSSMGALVAGSGNAALSPSVTFATIGTYSVRACSDKTTSLGGGVISESDELNNCSAWTDVVVSNSSGTIPVVSISAYPTSGTVNVVNPELTWSVTNSPTSCSFKGDWTNTSGGAFSGINISQGVLTSIRAYTYTLTCSNSFGTSAPAAAQVVVNDGPTATADIWVSPTSVFQGTSAELGWSSTGAGSCVGTNFNTAGRTSGSIKVNPLSTTTYTVNCDGALASVTLTVKHKPVIIEN